MAGAPEGNTNSNSNNRLWANTIRKAVIQADPEKLMRIANAMLAKAEEGDMIAIKELGDRLDGKSMQVTESKTEISGKLQIGWTA